MKNPERLRTIFSQGSGTCTVLPAIGNAHSPTTISCTGSGDLNMTEVLGSSLTVSCSGSADANANLCKTSLLKICSSGSGDVVTHCDTNSHVTVTCSGSGDICLKGVAQSVKGSVSGSGEVDLRELTVTRHNVRIREY